MPRSVSHWESGVGRRGRWERKGREGKEEARRPGRVIESSIGVAGQRTVPVYVLGPGM